MSSQSNPTVHDSLQIPSVDFSMQHNVNSLQENFSGWINNQHQVLPNPNEEVAHCSKRDWFNERSGSSKTKQNSEKKKVPQNDQNAAYIELDSDDDVELIDLTDAQESTNAFINFGENADLIRSLLSAYNIVDIASEQTQAQCTNQVNIDDVISLCSESDALSVDMDRLNYLQDTGQDNSSQANHISSDNLAFTPLVDLIDSEDDSPVEIIETDTALFSHSFTSILSPFGVANDFENNEIKPEDAGGHVNINEDVNNICNSILSTINIKDTEKVDVDLTAEPSGKKRKRGKRKKKKKKLPPPPPHILRQIIQRRKEEKLRRMEISKKDNEKSDIKKEDKKDECKVEVPPVQVSPAVTEVTSSGARTLATQTASIFRIALKDEPNEIKKET